jgi:hypothetical protein
MKLWSERAKNSRDIEYILVINEDEKEAYDNEAYKLCNWARFVFIRAAVKYSAPAWNAGASASTSGILVQGQDDVEPPQDWDQSLLWMLKENGLTIADPAFIAVSDGYRKGDHGELCTTAIMTVAYRDMEGFFLFPGYRSVYSDDEVTYRAMRHQQEGEAHCIRAKHLVFKHEHHYHVKGPKGEALVPWDETYAEQNSAEAYTHGRRLFLERNPRVLTDGLKKW